MKKIQDPEDVVEKYSMVYTEHREMLLTVLQIINTKNYV